MCPSPQSEIRARIIAEARSWLRTPWHHEGRTKGVGVDCAQFLIGVYVAAGLVDEFQTDQYPPDWHLHRDEPRFLAYLLQYAEQVNSPLPGDVCMFKYGRHAAHGSIVVDWPLVVHAYKDDGMVVLTDVLASPLRERVDGFFRLKGIE
jgi:cell wall-associated NlpC family hydrolase